MTVSQLRAPGRLHLHPPPRKRIRLGKCVDVVVVEIFPSDGGTFSTATISWSMDFSFFMFLFLLKRPERLKQYLICLTDWRVTTQWDREKTGSLPLLILHFSSIFERKEKHFLAEQKEMYLWSIGSRS